MANYGTLTGGWTSCPIAPHSMGLWKYIGAGVTSFSSLVAFEIGDGSTVHLWEDVWCDVISLKLAYPDLFCLACLTNATVADFVSVQHNSFLCALFF